MHKFREIPDSAFLISTKSLNRSRRQKQNKDEQVSAYECGHQNSPSGWKGKTGKRYSIFGIKATSHIKKQ